MGIRNLANVTDRTRVSGETGDDSFEDIEISFEDSPQASTRVGILPEGIGVKGRLSWLSHRWFHRPFHRTFLLGRAHAKRIGICLGIVVLAGAGWAVGAEAFRDAYRSATASRETAPAKKTATAAKKSPAVSTGGTVTRSASPARVTTRKPAPKKSTARTARAANEWKPAPTPAAVKSAPASSSSGSSDLVSAGHIYMRTGRLAAAEEAYREALQQNKKNGEARFWLATAESSQGKKWRACRHFRIYVEEFPNGPHAHDARTNLRACE